MWSRDLLNLALRPETFRINSAGPSSTKCCTFCPPSSIHNAFLKITDKHRKIWPKARMWVNKTFGIRLFHRYECEKMFVCVFMRGLTKQWRSVETQSLSDQQTAEHTRLYLWSWSAYTQTCFHARSIPPASRGTFAWNYCWYFYSHGLEKKTNCHRGWSTRTTSRQGTKNRHVLLLPCKL